MSIIKEHKKIVAFIILIILSPFIIPIVELIAKMIFSLGTYVGTKIRYIVEGKIC